MTLAQLRKFALSLPGSIEEPHFERTSLHAGCMAKLPWGSKVVGLRVHLAKAPAGVVKDLVKAAWQARAPGTR